MLLVFFKSGGSDIEVFETIDTFLSESVKIFNFFYANVGTCFSLTGITIYFRVFLSGVPTNDRLCIYFSLDNFLEILLLFSTYFNTLYTI